MKRLVQPYNKQLGAVKIFKEELEDIYSLLSEIGNPISIESENYSYNSFEDLVENFKNEKTLHFQTESNSHLQVEVLFQKSFTTIRSSGKDIGKVAHYFNQLIVIIQPKVKRKFFILHPIIWGSGTLFIISEYFHPILPAQIKSGIFYIIVCTLVYLMLQWSFIHNIPRSNISVNEKSASKNIFERTKDDIFSNVIASLVTSIIGFIAGIIAVKIGLIK